MAKTKKSKGKTKKFYVRSLRSMGKKITAMVSQMNTLMTSTAFSESLHKPEPITNVEKLEEIIGMEPPKETLWARTIDVNNGNIMNDSCNTAVVLSNDRATVDNVAMYMSKINNIMKTDIPALIPNTLMMTYNQFVHDTEELISRDYKIPKPDRDKIEVNIYPVLAYMTSGIINTQLSDVERSKILTDVENGNNLTIKKIRESNTLWKYTFIDLNECVVDVRRYNNAEKSSEVLQYNKSTIKYITDKTEDIEMDSIKVCLPIYKIEKDRRIRIAYIEVTCGGAVITAVNSGNMRAFIDNDHIEYGDKDNPFTITSIELDISTRTNAPHTNHSYISLSDIILNDNEFGNESTIQKIILDVSRYWTSLE